MGFINTMALTSWCLSFKFSLLLYENYVKFLCITINEQYIIFHSCQQAKTTVSTTTATATTDSCPASYCPAVPSSHSMATTRPATWSATTARVTTATSATTTSPSNTALTAAATDPAATSRATPSDDGSADKTEWTEPGSTVSKPHTTTTGELNLVTQYSNLI